MANQNVTLSLPEELLRQVKHLAIDEGVSLSRFVARLLEEQVESKGQYRAAKDRQLGLMEGGLALDTGSTVTWDRADLHER